MAYPFRSTDVTPLHRYVLFDSRDGPFRSSRSCLTQLTSAPFTFQTTTTFLKTQQRKRFENLLLAGRVPSALPHQSYRDARRSTLTTLFFARGTARNRLSDPTVLRALEWLEL